LVSSDIGQVISKPLLLSISGLIIGTSPGTWVSAVCVEHLYFRKGNFALYDIQSWNVPSQLPLGAAALGACALSFALVIPSMSQVSQTGDPFLLLDTPMVMNGMTLILYGVIIFALGKIIELLTQSPGRPPDLSAEGERKVQLTCPNCAQQMRIPAGNQGTIKCPKCSTRFEIAS